MPFIDSTDVRKTLTRLAGRARALQATLDKVEAIISDASDPDFPLYAVERHVYKLREDLRAALLTNSHSIHVYEGVLARTLEEEAHAAHA